MVINTPPPVKYHFVKRVLHLSEKVLFSEKKVIQMQRKYASLL